MRKTNVVLFTKYLIAFLSIAFIQPKAGPQSLGTPFSVRLGRSLLSLFCLSLYPI